MVTTIKLQEKTKSNLDKYREYRNETYEDVVRKLIYIADTAKLEPHLSKQAILDIEAARERIKKGQYYTEANVKKMLGL